MKQLSEYPTPLTDALCSDPAIERRDVPARVWRRMDELERKLAMCRDLIFIFVIAPASASASVAKVMAETEVKPHIQ